MAVDLSADPAHDDCVVCMVGNGDLEHDPNEHRLAGYHAADGTPTSEPCPGVNECTDCQDVLVSTGRARVLPCGCVAHVTRMTNLGFHCVTENQGYCNFECPHEGED